MNFIKKIVDKRVDESVHLQFQKFSKGEFRDRAMIEAKKTGKGYAIKTSAEFANGLIRDVAEILGNNKTKVTGTIVSTVNLKEIPEFAKILAQVEVKQFQGVKRFMINNEFSGNEIIRMLDVFPKAFFALSFSVGETQLKIKPKAPKSGKPGKESEDGPKVDFCSLKTDKDEIGKCFIFENPNFKEAKINHTFFVEQIIMPEGEKEFAKIREMAKRKGKIVRKALIDGKEVVININFEA